MSETCETCETCKWYQVRRVDDWGFCFVEPPVLRTDIEMSPEVRHFHRCSKWETKLERKCENCEHFVEKSDGSMLPASADGFCTKNPPVVLLYENKHPATCWPAVEKDVKCGEFRGRE